MKQVADYSIEEVRAGEKCDRRLFPYTEELHFLFELRIAPVMLQALPEALDSLLLPAIGKEGLAEIEIQDGIDPSRALGIGGFELDEGFPAGGQAALVFLVHNSLEPAEIGEDDRMAWVDRAGPEQYTVSLLVPAVPEMSACRLDIFDSGSFSGLVRLF